MEPDPANASERTYGTVVTRLVTPWSAKGEYYRNLTIKHVMQISATIQNFSFL